METQSKKRRIRIERASLSIALLLTSLVAVIFSVNNVLHISQHTAYSYYALFTGAISLICFGIHLFSSISMMRRNKSVHPKGLSIFRITLISLMVLWSLLILLQGGAISVNEVMFAWYIFISFEIFQVLRTKNTSFAQERQMTHDFPLKKVMLAALVLFGVEVIVYHMLHGIPHIYPMYAVYLTLFLVIISSPILFAGLAIREILYARKYS